MKNRSWYLFMVLMLAISLGGNAATIYVVPGGAGTQDGTSWANAKNLYFGINNASPTDTLWVKQGTYQIATSLGLATVCRVYGGFVGNETALDQRNPDPTLTIIKSPVWRLTTSTAELHDLNLTISSAGYCTIVINDGTIDNCIIQGGKVDIYASSSSGAEVHNTTFSDQINASAFVLVRSDGKAYFYDCEFHNLDSNDGGAIQNTGVLEVHRSVFHNNTATFRGGAIFSSTRVKIHNSLFYNNTADGGGALFFQSVPGGQVLDIRNCTFIGNSTTNSEGHGTIEINDGFARMNIFNSVIWGNTGGVGDIVNAPYYAGTENIFNNVLERGIVDYFSYQTTNQGDNIDLDPIFVDAGANDYRLDPCSPAINTGANNFVIGAQDLDGNLRIYEETVDRGAYELQVGISTCNEPPIAICQNLTVYTDDGCRHSGTVASDFDGGSVDPEGGALSFSVTPAGSYPRGTRTVTLTVSDPENNVSTCSATISVIDNEAPTVTCPADQTLPVDPDECEASVTVPFPFFDDNCGVVSVVNDFTGTDDASGIYPVGTTTVTWTITDNSGNTGTCTTNVSVNDNVAPTAACRDASVELDANGNANITTWHINNNSYDACGIASLNLDREDFSCTDVGTQVVTLTVTDNNGNSSTCTANVSVQNHQVPYAVCMDTSVDLDANGNGYITTSDIDNNSYYACGVASLDREDFSCADVGTQIVTLTVSNNSGNSSTCTANVSVNDPVAPMAACRDVWLTLSSGEPGYITTSDINDASYDACGIASLSLDREDFSCADIGTHVVTLTVIDNNGNSSTCTANVNVQDKLPPTAVCRDATVELDANGNGNITGTDINNNSYDACGIASLNLNREDFSCADVGTQVVTLTVTDNSGNSSTCTANVSVNDHVAPTAACKDATVELDANTDGNITTSDINNNSYDACGIASLNLDKQHFDCTETGTQVVTLTVTDNNGNTSTCTANVSVEDNQPPTAACRDVTVELDANGNGTITGTDINNNSYDDCGIASLNLDKEDFSCADVGTQVVTLTVTDNNGNTSTCTANVSVNDNQVPYAVCRNVSVELDDIGNANITTADINNASYDACGIASLNLDKEDFSCADIGTQVVALTVTDNNGNTSTCMANVSVNDNQVPFAVCRDVSVELDVIGNANLTTADINNASYDACGIASLNLDKENFSCADIGTQVVALTVIDNNGNTSTCTANVSVNDNQVPYAVCRNVSVELDDNGNANITTADINNASYDACGIASLNLDKEDFSCADIGTQVVALTVTDNNGNTSTCTATVTINPSIACQEDCTSIDQTVSGTINTDLEVHTQSSVSLSNALIENGVTVNITAGNIITFEPGTIIQAGAQFSARIEDCNPEVQTLSESELPETALSANRPIGQLRVAPNPFRQQVNISFELLEAAPVSLIIYNALGRRVSVLAAEENYPIGHQEWTFLRNDHPAGLYLAHLKVGDQLYIKKMILVE